MVASLKYLSTHTRIIIQAYIHSDSFLESIEYMRRPRELKFQSAKVLKVVKPLYGIAGSSLHWYLTNTDHHADNLDMQRARVDTRVHFE